MDVVCQYSPRSRVSGWTVTVAMTVLCYYRSERERERGWSCGISARTVAAERASERGLEPVRMMGVVGSGMGLFTNRLCSGGF